MLPFRSRTVSSTDTLGERLRRLREEQERSVEDVASSLRMNPKYLVALEEGRYEDLPGPVYAKQFVRQYARFLNVRENAALQQFEREYAISRKIHLPALIPQSSKGPRVHPILTPHGIRRSFILLLAVAVLVYLGVEVVNLTSAPPLTVTAPPENLPPITERSVELSGSTKPETTVTVNGRAIMVDQQGRFREVLDLQEGQNNIVIRAERKRGGVTTVKRTVVVKSP